MTKPSRLWRVTITGADDNTPIEQMVQMSTEYPWLEWGILISENHQNDSIPAPRFPSPSWLTELMKASRGCLMHLSTHVCGKWARDVLRGALAMCTMPELFKVSQRIQLNPAGHPMKINDRSLEMIWRETTGKQVIYQMDGVNDRIPGVAFQIAGPHAAGLVDRSCGRGKTPEQWKCPSVVHPVGFAGGLKPENVVYEIERIHDVWSSPFWIDMESGVRDSQDRMDMTRVWAVLEACKPWVNQSAGPTL